MQQDEAKWSWLVKQCDVESLLRRWVCIPLHGVSGLPFFFWEKRGTLFCRWCSSLLWNPCNATCTKALMKGFNFHNFLSRTIVFCQFFVLVFTLHICSCLCPCGTKIRHWLGYYMFSSPNPQFPLNYRLSYSYPSNIMTNKWWPGSKRNN